jgi:hypothetical protein
MKLAPGKYDNIEDLLTEFPDERSCVIHIHKMLFKDTWRCERCDHNEFYTYKARPYVYDCKRCRMQSSPLRGTVFQDTHMPLRSWFKAIYYITSQPGGFSSIQLSKEMKATQNTAWTIIQKIRTLVEDANSVKLMSNGDYIIEKIPITDDFIKLSGIIEIDEVYIGGKNDNKHADKKIKGVQGVSQKIKVPLLGMHERETGRTVCVPLMKVNGETVLEIIQRYVDVGSVLHTDENKIYLNCDAHYERHFTNHSAKEYVRGNVHSNTIENVWAQLRRGIIGAYYHISEKHSHRYFSEFAFRYQHSKVGQSDKFDMALKKMNKVVTKKSIMAHTPELNNYSGRGQDYPIELQKKTKLRGAYSDMIKEFFIEFQKEMNPIEKRRFEKYKRKRYKDALHERYPSNRDSDDSKIVVIGLVPPKRRGRPPGVKNKPKVVEVVLVKKASKKVVAKVKKVIKKVSIKKKTTVKKKK